MLQITIEQEKELVEFIIEDFGIDLDKGMFTEATLQMFENIAGFDSPNESEVQSIIVLIPQWGRNSNVTSEIRRSECVQCGDKPSNPVTGQQAKYSWKWCGFVLNGDGMGRTVPDTGLSHRVFNQLASSDNPQMALFQKTHHRSLGSFRSTIELHPREEHFTQVSRYAAIMREMRWEQ